MTVTINAVTSTGLVQTSDGSGVLKVQSNGVTTNALAWVNFAGASGTRNASYNVSSVTRNSTGNYNINFANPLTDANYSISAVASTLSGIGLTITTVNDANIGTAPTTSLFQITTRQISTANVDPTFVYCAVFGN